MSDFMVNNTNIVLNNHYGTFGTTITGTNGVYAQVGIVLSNAEAGDDAGTIPPDADTYVSISADSNMWNYESACLVMVSCANPSVSGQSKFLTATDPLYTVQLTTVGDGTYQTGVYPTVGAVSVSLHIGQIFQYTYGTATFYVGNS